jgi:hypothetical protein
LKHSRKTSGVRIGRVVSSFSFLLLLAVVALGGEFGDLKAELAAAKTPQEKVSLLNSSEIEDDELYRLAIDAKESDSASIARATDYVDLKAIAESTTLSNGQSERAKKIKSSTLYRDTQKDNANWLSGAVARLKNLVPKFPESNGPRLGGVPSAGAGLLLPIIWFLLFALVVGFIIYAVRFVTFGKLKKRKGKAMLEDDEPERTLDEWLALADAYQKEGRFREAVRALYLACLLKFDERNIARFLRGQTNWEHLARIEASPKMPAGINFRAATQAFDQVWYGHKVRGAVDVDEFRQWYGEVSTALKEAA